MISIILSLKKNLWLVKRLLVTHFIGRITKRYYFEDYIRVYPDDIIFDSFGKRYRPEGI
jgi:hypothetical protein